MAEVYHIYRQDADTTKLSDVKTKAMSRFNNPIKDTIQNRKHVKEMLRWMEKHYNICESVLDIGKRNNLTKAMEDKFGVAIDSTHGDLDVDFWVEEYRYNFIIYSHVIEHQFNPLHTLLMLKMCLNEGGSVLIVTPCGKPKILWGEGHYHEIDKGRMYEMIKKAGLKVACYDKVKSWREWWFYFKGLRPFLRLFFEWNAYYIITK